jgi:hypothetical protein
VLADTHFEHGPVFVDDDTRHLQPKDLATEYAVLDDRFRTGGAHDVGQRCHTRIERRRGRDRPGLRRRQRGAVDAPDPGRLRERARPAGENSGGLAVIDEEVQMLDRQTPRPEEPPAEGPRRLLVSENPTGRALDRGGASRKALVSSVALAPLALDEGAQLRPAKGLLPVSVGYYFLVPLRAP